MKYFQILLYNLVLYGLLGTCQLQAQIDINGLFIFMNLEDAKAILPSLKYTGEGNLFMAKSYETEEDGVHYTVEGMKTDDGVISVISIIASRAGSVPLYNNEVSGALRIIGKPPKVVSGPSEMLPLYTSLWDLYPPLTAEYSIMYSMLNNKLIYNLGVDWGRMSKSMGVE